MNKRSDAYIINQLSSENQLERQEAIRYIYEIMHDKVVAYILKNSGNLSDTDDVFQDSIVALYKQARAGKLGEQIQIAPYFFTICKNHWLKALQKRKKTVELTPDYKNSSNEVSQETILITDERNALMNDLLRRLGASCYQILRQYYYEKRRMKEIAGLLNLSNEQAAKDKKASCMKKLRKLIKEQPHPLELLKK